MPLVVSSSASSNPGMTSYGCQDPGKSVSSDDRSGKFENSSTTRLFKRGLWSILVFSRVEKWMGNFEQVRFFHHMTFWRFLGHPFEQVQFLPLMTFCLFLARPHFSSGFKHFSGEEPAQILPHITFWLFLGPSSPPSLSKTLNPPKP